MPNQQKRDIVKNIQEKLERAKSVYFTDYLGLDVADITELRRHFREKGVEFTVVKNTLARLSVEKAGIEGLEEVFEGPTAIAFSYDDPISPARVLRNYKESHDLPELKAFIIEDRVMDKTAFTRIAQIPSREELFAKLLAGLSSPMTKVVLTLKSPLIKLVNTLNKLKEIKQS